MSARLLLSVACFAVSVSAAASELKTSIVYPGATLEIRARSAGESLDCPSDLPACPADARLDGPIVLDPGHDDTNAGTRSDPSYIEPPASSPEARVPAGAPKPVKYYEPYEGKAKPTSWWTELRKEERQPIDPKAGFSPFIHEGHGNLAVSILAKLYLDRCVFKRAASAPPVRLTRWPGESVFGEYENPTWAARARARVGGEPFIMAESKNEHINKKDDTASIRYDYNSNWGTPYNSRILYSNLLLGLADPFARRIATRDELRSGKPLPPGVFNPADPAWRSEGMFVSIHEDTKPIQVPSGFKGDRRTLRARDQVLVTYPRVPYGAGPLPEKISDYETEPADGTPGQNPTGAAQASRMGAILKDRMQPFYPKALPLDTQPRPLLMLARNLLVERKVLIEGFDMTGGARDSVEAQIQKGDRSLHVEVRAKPGKTSRYELPISDLHILFAQGVAAAIGAELCGAGR